MLGWLPLAGVCRVASHWMRHGEERALQLQQALVQELHVQGVAGRVDLVQLVVVHLGECPLHKSKVALITNRKVWKLLLTNCKGIRGFTLATKDHLLSSPREGH